MPTSDRRRMPWLRREEVEVPPRVQWLIDSTTMSSAFRTMCAVHDVRSRHEGVKRLRTSRDRPPGLHSTRRATGPRSSRTRPPALARPPGRPAR
ncbi:hypothetical protein [Streptomyces altiplanensis]